jgi:flavin-dependent dehydrogenase
VPEPFDAVVVGARVAGSVTAALLGGAGHRVLLVDSAHFPSDTISTHFFRGAGLVSILQRLGVLDAVLAAGSPRLTVEYSFGAGQKEPTVGPPQNPGDAGHNLSVRRSVLDHILVERARSTPGVTVMEGTTLRDLVRTDDGRVTGVHLDRGGERCSVPARIVVGADGRSSTVARLVAAPELRREAASRAMYFRYLRDFRGPDGSWDGPEFSFVGDELAYAFPSDAGITCLAISINLDGFAVFRASPEAAFAERLAAHVGMHDRFRAATTEGRMLGSGPKDAVIRAPSGPGWALVGDAAMHQDPWTGYGMDNAAIHASFLAEAIDAWLGGRTTARAAMGEYAARRDAHALEGFEFTAAQGRDLSHS